MKSFFSLVLAITCATSYAATRTVVGNATQAGKSGWENPNNWNPIGVPQNGDAVLIPAGATISVKNNVYTSPVDLKIDVYGTIDFDPSGRLNLGVHGVIQLRTNAARISTNGTASEQILIGGLLKYNGRNDGVVTGPAFTNYSAPNSSNRTPAEGFILGVLPVRLTSFAASYQNGTIQLSWTSAQEDGVKDFELQRSSANSSNWSTVTRVAAKNTCSCPTTYQFQEVVSQSGTYLYRLRINDLDGTAEYTKNVAVSAKNIGDNPVLWSRAGGGSAIKLVAEQSNLSFPVRTQLYTSGGSLLQTKSFTTPGFSIEMGNLQPGFYIIRLQDKQGKTYTEKNILVVLWQTKQKNAGYKSL